MKYLRVFESVSAYNTFADSEEYVEPNTSLVTGECVKYNKEVGPIPPAPSGYAAQYLTVEFLDDGDFGTNNDGYEYSTDDGETWNELSWMDVYTGDKLMLRGNVKYSGGSDGRFGGSAHFNVYGNIMSIYDKENFRSITSFSNGDSFSCLFQYAYVVSAENLVLPATALTNYCYGSMFDGCTGLTTAPELPATTLAESCYNGMFTYCTSLTTAPELPATTLAEGCYENMFTGCTSLNYIKCLAIDISARACTGGWVYDVAPSGTFVKNPNMTDWSQEEYNYNGIPYGWTVQDAS